MAPGLGISRHCSRYFGRRETSIKLIIVAKCSMSWPLHCKDLCCLFARMLIDLYNVTIQINFISGQFFAIAPLACKLGSVGQGLP